MLNELPPAVVAAVTVDLIGDACLITGRKSEDMAVIDAPVSNRKDTLTSPTEASTQGRSLHLGTTTLEALGQDFGRPN